MGYQPHKAHLGVLQKAPFRGLHKLPLGCCRKKLPLGRFGEIPFGSCKKLPLGGFTKPPFGCCGKLRLGALQSFPRVSSSRGLVRLYGCIQKVSQGLHEAPNVFVFFASGT